MNYLAFCDTKVQLFRQTTMISSKFFHFAASFCQIRNDRNISTKALYRSFSSDICQP